jgi:hypothetical protein
MCLHVCKMVYISFFLFVCVCVWLFLSYYHNAPQFLYIFLVAFPAEFVMYGGT